MSGQEHAAIDDPRIIVTSTIEDRGRSYLMVVHALKGLG